MPLAAHHDWLALLTSCRWPHRQWRSQPGAAGRAAPPVSEPRGSANTPVAGYPAADAWQPAAGGRPDGWHLGWHPTYTSQANSGDTHAACSPSEAAAIAGAVTRSSTGQETL
jgi:hypothetical protein